MYLGKKLIRIKKLFHKVLRMKSDNVDNIPTGSLPVEAMAGPSTSALARGAFRSLQLERPGLPRSVRWKSRIPSATPWWRRCLPHCHSKLEREMRDIEEEVEDIHLDMNLLKDEVSSIKDEVKSVKDEVGTVKEELGALKAELESLKHEVQVLNEAVKLVLHQQEEERGFRLAFEERFLQALQDIRNLDTKVTNLPDTGNV